MDFHAFIVLPPLAQHFLGWLQVVSRLAENVMYQLLTAYSMAPQELTEEEWNSGDSWSQLPDSPAQQWFLKLHQSLKTSGQYLFQSRALLWIQVFKIRRNLYFARNLGMRDSLFICRAYCQSRIETRWFRIWTISHNLIIAVVRDRLRQTLEKESWIWKLTSGILVNILVVLFSKSNVVWQGLGVEMGNEVLKFLSLRLYLMNFLPFLPSVPWWEKNSFDDFWK